MLTLRPEKVTTTWPSLGPPPRLASLRRRTWLIGAGVPALCLLLAVLIWRGQQEELAVLQELSETGTERAGQVIGRRTSRTGRSTDYLVVCQFPVGGGWYRQEFESKSVYDRAPRDRNVVVTYAAASPLRARLGTRAELAAERDRRLSIRWLPPGVLLVMGSLFASVYWVSAYTQLRLARDGIVRWGTVTHIRQVKRNSIVTVAVDDAWGSTTLNGEAVADFERFQPIGSQAAVLSDPADPSRARLAEEVTDRVVIAKQS